jgi:predicted RNA-binding Zn-ribbon protein involved in translation (DUF1610 family)
LSDNLCPECGAHVYRSHTRGFKEKFIKVVTSHRAYRCHECGWRGWFGKSRLLIRKSVLRTVISLLLTLLITTLLALYIVDKLSPDISPIDTQQQHTP